MSDDVEKDATSAAADIIHQNERSGQESALVLSTSWVPDQNPVLVYLGRLAPGSRSTMHRALAVVAGLLQGAGGADPALLLWPSVRYQHVARVRQVLLERYAPATANKILCAVRGVLKECWRLGHLGAEEYHRAVDVAGVRYEVLPAGRALSAGELAALFSACASDPHPAAGARDAALLALQYGVLLRRAEAAALLLSDYADGEVKVRKGKGRKERLGHAQDGTRRAIEAWLALRGGDDGPLLCPVNKAGRATIRALTPPAINEIYRRRAAQAKVRPFSSHDLRRSGISDLLDRGADIATVKKMAGHAQVTTTAGYDRRDERTKARAAELLHVPYVPLENPTPAS